MNLTKLFTDDRAVSPVVGVALLIAITVILAAVIGGVVLGLGTSSADGPQASLQFEYDGATSLTISHEGGDSIANANTEVRFNDADTNANKNLGQDLAAGQSATITLDTALDSGDSASVVWMDPESNNEAVLGTYEH